MSSVRRMARPRASRQLKLAADRCAACAVMYYTARLVFNGVVQALCGLWLNGPGVGAAPEHWELVTWVGSLFSNAAALLFPVVLAVKLWPQTVRLGLKPAGMQKVGVMLPLFLGGGQLFGLLAGVVGDLTGSSRQVALPSHPAALLLAFATLCLVPAVLEEVLFRGLIQNVLQPHGDWVSVTGQAVLFALLHGDMASMFYAFPTGLFLGVLALQTGSICPGILLHGANNTLSFVLVLLRSGGYASLASVLSMCCLVIFPAWAAAVLVRSRRIKKHIWNPIQPGVPPTALLDCRALLCTAAILLAGAVFRAVFA